MYVHECTEHNVECAFVCTLLLNLCVFCKHYCRKRNACTHTLTQERHPEKKHNNIHSRNTAHFLCFPPQSKAAAHLPSVWVLVSDKAFFFFFCLQPAVIHNIWGLLLALYSTVGWSRRHKAQAYWHVPASVSCSTTTQQQCVQVCTYSLQGSRILLDPSRLYKDFHQGKSPFSRLYRKENFDMS